MMMHTIGRDASIPDLQRQKMKRVKKGECPECGTLLFKKSMLRKATPLTIKGKCRKGRCLVCFPLTSAEEAERKIPIPREIITCCTLPVDRTNNNGEEPLNNSVGNFTFDQDDDVSAITLDRRIRTECEQVDQCGAAAATSRGDSCARGMTVLGLLATEEEGEGDDVDDDNSGASSGDCESLSSLRERMVEYLKSAQGSQREIMQRWDKNHRRTFRKQKTTNKDTVLPEQAPPRPLPVQHESLENSANNNNQEDSTNSDGDIQIISDLLPESARPPRPHEVSPGKLHHKRVFQPHVFVPPTGKTNSNAITNNNNVLISRTTTTATTTTTANTTQSSSGDNSPKHNSNNNNINEHDSIVARVMLDETAVRKETTAYILEGSFREILFNADDDDDDNGPDGQADNNNSSSSSNQGPQKVPTKFNSSSSSNSNNIHNSGGEEQSCTETGESLAALMEISVTQNNDSDWYGPEDDEDHCVEQWQQPQPTVRIPLDPFPVSPSQRHHTISVAARVASDNSLQTDQINDNIENDHQQHLHHLQPPLSPSSLSDSKPAASPIKSTATSTIQNQQQEQSRHHHHHSAPPSSAMMMMFDSSFSEIHDLQNHPSASTTLDSLLDDLQNKDSTARDHEFTLCQLAEYLWNNHHNGGRRAFVASQGVPLLTSVLWMDMMTPSTATAAAEVLLALLSRSAPETYHAGKKDYGDDNDTDKEDDLNNGNEDLGLIREELEGVVDALLITMQTLIMDEGLQQAGCRVLCALVGRASSCDSDNNNNASSSSSYFYDGTSAGAVSTVLNAMDAHATSPVVQEWGLRALCRQCSDSHRAEANQRTVLSSASQLNTTGATGGEVLERLLVQYDKTHAEHLKDGGVLEWACQLCWCLSAGRETVSEMVTLRFEALRELLHILEQCRSIPDASAHLQQAVLGIIANLSRMDRYRSFLGTSDVILLVLDTMHTNKQHMEVQIEACNVIANVSSILSPVERDEIVDSGAVRTIVGAMFAFAQEKTSIQEPALRGLVALAIKSEIGKEDICEHDTLSVLMQLCRLDGRSTLLQQEMLCTLIASIYASDRLQSKAIKCDTFGALTAAMVSFSKSETIQSACLTAYRNLSRSNLENLARGHEVCLAVNTMITFRHNKSIQINACCVLWNMGAGTKSGHQIIAQTKAVECIVNAIQTHLDAPEVVEFACGALWGLIHQSQTLRQQFFDVDGGVEAVACTLLMYQESVLILEKACGVLAIVASASPPTCSVAIAVDGVTNMVQVLRSNPRSVTVLQHGAHFLRVAIQRDPNLADAASGALSVLIDALKDFTQVDALLREACYFIWAISGVSGDAKSKVIALEGESVLLWLLDQRSGTEMIEDAALGAFRELALVPSN